MTATIPPPEDAPFPLGSVQAVATRAWALCLREDPFGLLVVPFVIYFPVYVSLTIMAELVDDIEALAHEASLLSMLVGVLPLVIFARVLGESWIIVRADAEAHGRNVSYGATLSHAFARSWYLVVVLIAVYALVQLGLFLLVIPGVIVWIIARSNQAAVLGPALLASLLLSRDLLEHTSPHGAACSRVVRRVPGTGDVIGIVKQSLAAVIGGPSKFLFDLALVLPLQIALFVFTTCWTLSIANSGAPASAPAHRARRVRAAARVGHVRAREDALAIRSPNRRCHPACVRSDRRMRPGIRCARPCSRARAHRVCRVVGAGRAAGRGADVRAVRRALDALEVRWARRRRRAGPARERPAAHAGRARLDRARPAGAASALWVEAVAAIAGHATGVARAIAALPATLDPRSSSLAEKQVATVTRASCASAPAPSAAGGGGFDRARRAPLDVPPAQGRPLHDGRPVRAEDVVASLRRALSSRTRHRASGASRTIVGAARSARTGR